MNRLVKTLIVLLAVVLFFGPAGKLSPVSAEEGILKALMVTGQSSQYHNWQVSSPILKQLLEEAGLFDIDVATSPPRSADMSNFKPSFADYDVVVLDYEGDQWPEQTKAAFVEYVKSGGGVVIYHATDNAFPQWKEFNEIIGLGGWGGRDEKAGPYVYWQDDRAVYDVSPGPGETHGPAHDFQVVNRNREHPITRDLPEKWMHAKDELYSKLRGPAENLTILSTAYADPAKKGGTGRDEPILFTINYGKGRIFHTVLGHVGAKDAPPITTMDCVGFIVTFQRGAEWAATGEVTQKVPEDFPTAAEVRIRKSCKAAKSLDELLEEAAGYEFGQSRERLVELTEIIRNSSVQQKKDIERKLLKVLQSDATLAGRQFICRQLSIIGTEESVPMLADMLTSETTSDMARYALERIPGEAVDKALCEALVKTSGTVKLGIINSLGQRGAKEATAALSALLADSDRKIVQAAAAALGKIGGPSAAKSLKTALVKTTGGLRPAMTGAYLACADKFLAEADNEQALAIYEQLYVPTESTPTRIAAMRGIAAASPQKAGEIITEAVSGDEPVVQAAAIGLLGEMKEADAGPAVAKLSNLPPAAQVQMLSALADRGDRSALPAVLNATKSNEDSVSIAALEALAVLGDASTVVLLAEAAASTQGARQEAARMSLYRLRGPEVDEIIVASIPKAEPKVKFELIRSIGKRSITAGAETLLETAQDENRNVRLASIEVLADIAGPEHASQLVDILVNARDETERKETKRAVVSVSHKSAGENTAAKAVLDALDSAEGVNVRRSLLGVLGEIQGDEALGVLRTALNDKNAKVRTTAIRALSNWSNCEPADDLLKLARGADDEANRTLALRGFIRLTGLDDNRPAGKKVELYRQAMTLASGLSEKKLILSGLAGTKSIESLEMAGEYLDDEQLQREAEAAVVKIAEATIENHPDKTKAALQKVLEVSKNQTLREQVQKMIEQI